MDNFLAAHIRNKNLVKTQSKRVIEIEKDDLLLDHMEHMVENITKTEEKSNVSNFEIIKMSLKSRRNYYRSKNPIKRYLIELDVILEEKEKEEKEEEIIDNDMEISSGDELASDSESELYDEETEQDKHEIYQIFNKLSEKFGGLL